MDGSRQKVGVDAFNTFAPVIDCSADRLLISTAFGNGWEMYHWDISVAYTNADSHEPTYVRFPKNFPDDICPGYTGGTLVRLTKNLYGIKSTIVWFDNTAALAVATGNDFPHETVKHVTVKVRFLQECVQHKIIRLT
jgi:hypothetical protein